MENTKNKEELIEELEGILKANKDNIYCDEYQIADMIREALKDCEDCRVMPMKEWQKLVRESNFK